MYINGKVENETQLKEKLDLIYAKSKEGRNFHGLWELAFNPITITTAIHNIKSNKGAQTSGIDRLNMDYYLQMPYENLIELVMQTAKNYQPKPAKRIYIPKSNGKLRPLGIPTILDRIIQECVRIVIEPIVEAKFYQHSYGFRPYRATKHAIKQIVHLINTSKNDIPRFVIEGDIKNYFDSINHRILLKKLYKTGIHDKRILMIIKQMLKAGYIENDLYNITGLGTPQGGIISPILANIYLNDFDWTIARMYEQPKIQRCKNIIHDRARLKRQGITPKYLVRYADDWIIMTTTYNEAQRLLEYLKKYFKYKLKLELSEDKTVITDITQKPIKFLGFLIKAETKRPTPNDPKPNKIVGKLYPNFDKVKKQVREISKEIHKLTKISNEIDRAIQIEEINTMIIGIAEYWKTGICSQTFNYIDNKINRTAERIFRKIYPKAYQEHIVELNKLSNRPQRHSKYKTKTFAVKVNNMYIGITKTFITGSHWEKYPFNQKLTPYTKEGRQLYVKLNQKKLSLDRPPLYDETALSHSKNQKLYNFEYYMNREYAYNRDRGKCKICGIPLEKENRECHHLNPNLPLNQVNKVPNLVWLCKTCHDIVHGKEIPEYYTKKQKQKLAKYRELLQAGNDGDV
ncbi:group II intron reverse transcriptase/maturase [Thermoanaerobacter sp. RKWS2]|uniref:group II intron reverse transcriptase/maturase n=1 Tax=Thermoanaerobacter sp. RKWS2 TaxID=2983842 RepID=UPI00224B3ED3|nr:group II intron reverse transcriptase/maturase [Thermoanaerobacter sp. RKWS2]UZQ84256.1 group II intron reverse transcriptase/maturase [Thermoanaerobacter sp. RKWS2]